MVTRRRLLMLRRDHRPSFLYGIISLAPIVSVGFVGLLGGLLYVGVYVPFMRTMVCIIQQLAGVTPCHLTVPLVTGGWSDSLVIGFALSLGYFLLVRWSVKKDWVFATGERIHITPGHGWALVAAWASAHLSSTMLWWPVSLWVLIILWGAMLRIWRIAQTVGTWVLMIVHGKRCFPWILHHYFCRRYKVPFAQVEVRYGDDKKSLFVKGPFDAVECRQIQSLPELELNGLVNQIDVETTLDLKDYQVAVDRSSSVARRRRFDTITSPTQFPIRLMVGLLIAGISVLIGLYVVTGLPSWGDLEAGIEDFMIRRGFIDP